MPLSLVVRSLIVNMAVEACEDAEGGVPLSKRLAKLAEAADAVAWPESVAPAMAELRNAADSLAALVDQVSDAAADLGELAAAMTEGAPAEDA
jgi:hypothetical protein